MPAIRPIDVRLIDDLFGMGGGYVLGFSDKTFAEFFATELGVNIDDPRYRVEGTSKAKRLRYFLKSCDSKLQIRTLQALWEYREDDRRRRGLAENVADAERQFGLLIERLGGLADPKSVRTPHNSSAIDVACADKLKATLLQVTQLAPHARGYAFETFLKSMFDVNGLAGRASFGLVGEQIDGSFELSGETYLLEAKWTGARTGAAELHAFEGKLSNKAAWSRGLFVSQSGFTREGLHAFGRGKRVICMDGLDIYEMLDRRLSFAEVLARKVRRAAETGEPFTSVRDL